MSGKTMETVLGGGGALGGLAASVLGAPEVGIPMMLGGVGMATGSQLGGTTGGLEGGAAGAAAGVGGEGLMGMGPLSGMALGPFAQNTQAGAAAAQPATALAAKESIVPTLEKQGIEQGSKTIGNMISPPQAQAAPPQTPAMPQRPQQQPQPQPQQQQQPTAVAQQQAQPQPMNLLAEYRQFLSGVA
jgi:hypothetical protein